MKRVANVLIVAAVIVLSVFCGYMLGGSETSVQAASTFMYPHNPGTYESALGGGTTYDGSDETEILEQVSRQSFTWGTVLVYAERNTRNGYMMIFDKDGYPISTHEMKNVVGEPLRFGDDGAVMPRLEPESWQIVQQCSVPYHPQGEHYHMNTYFPSVYTGDGKGHDVDIGR